MRWWEEYTEREGAEMNANPSPGNKAGGLTTILEKSLGAMAKAGSTNLVDVVNYAEEITKKGFVFMDTPGYDPVAATGQVAGRRQPRLLHHRPRQRVRLQARAVDQARHQFGDVQSAWKTTWTSIAAPSSTARRRCSNAASAFSS